MTQGLKWIDDDYVEARKGGDGQHWELGNTELWHHDMAYLDPECIGEFAAHVEILNKALKDWEAAVKAAGDCDKAKAVAIGKGESVGWQVYRLECALHGLREQTSAVLPQANSSRGDVIEG